MNDTVLSIRLKTGSYNTTLSGVIFLFIPIIKTNMGSNFFVMLCTNSVGLTPRKSLQVLCWLFFRRHLNTLSYSSYRHTHCGFENLDFDMDTIFPKRIVLVRR